MGDRELTYLEDRLLAKLLVASDGEPVSDDLDELLHGVDWDSFTARAVGHGVAPLLHKKLDHLDVGTQMPQAVLAELEASFYAALTNYVRYEIELEKLLGLLQESNTEVILLKGAALANSAYPNPALRPISDIDVLVKESDWQNLREAFLALNYSHKHKDFQKFPTRLIKNDMMDHWLAFHKDGFSFDIKLDLFELGIGTKDPQRVWESAGHFSVGGAKALVLSPEYQLLHLCTHLNRHGFRRLIWFVDIALLVQGRALDWERLTFLARREGLVPVIYHVLLYVGAVCGDTVARDTLRKLRPSLLKRRIWSALWPQEDIMSFSGAHESALIFRKGAPAAELLYNVLLMGRAAEKLGYFTRKLLPPAEFLHERYATDAKRRGYLYYLVKRYGLAARKLLDREAS